jgi:hypothetical protein
MNTVTLETSQANKLYITDKDSLCIRFVILLGMYRSCG